MRAEALWVPADVLAKPWARARLSVVGAHDARTYCFTKNYGRSVDKSSGSCFLEGAPGPMADPRWALDRGGEGGLEGLHGRVRRFDPDELLALAGFPRAFAWPAGMALGKRWGLVGNSVCVEVVRAVMAVLFE